ncbi:MAG: hypothetical protein HYZ00_11335, partial [Candidatus Hydrogenedentes bacterium]|nr:hypothetical protein [Candidatus Hydrogenedentota bacterium]
AAPAPLEAARRLLRHSYPAPRDLGETLRRLAPFMGSVHRHVLQPGALHATIDLIERETCP